MEGMGRLQFSDLSTELPVLPYQLNIMQLQIFLFFLKYYSTKCGHTKYHPNDVG